MRERDDPGDGSGLRHTRWWQNLGVAPFAGRRCGGGPNLYRRADGMVRGIDTEGRPLISRGDDLRQALRHSRRRGQLEPAWNQQRLHRRTDGLHEFKRRLGLELVRRPAVRAADENWRW